MSQVLYIAAIVISVIGILLCIVALIGTCFLGIASTYVDYGWGAPFNEKSAFNDLCTLTRWMCCFVVAPIIISFTLMWLIYTDTIDLIVDKEIAFWLVAIIPFCWSLIATIIGFHLACNDKIKYGEI